jgi:hypothetical protein
VSFPGTVYSQLYSVASAYRRLQTDAGLDKFRTYLGQQPLIRLFVDGTSGRGHQSSSVRVLRQLAGPFQYGRTIEVAYRGGQSTLDNLRLLIPELHGGNGGTIGAATVTLVTYPVAAQAPVAAVGFTGGADGDDNYATGLRVSAFLRLQPYNWADFPDEIQWDSTFWPYLDLRQQSVLGGASFVRRAYSIPAPVAPTWAAYAGGPYADRVAILEWLVGQVGPNLDLCVTTGIRTNGKPEIGRSSDVIFNLVGGLLASQKSGANPAPGAKPVVVVNLDEMSGGGGDRQLELARQLLAGGLGEDELPYLDLQLVNDVDVVTPRGHSQTATDMSSAWRARHRYVCGPEVTAAARSRLRPQDTALPQIQQDVQTWLTQSTDRVLFLPIGPVPPPVFDYVFSRSTMPTVFEGQSSANLALTLGRPYFHVQRRSSQGSGGSQYPSTSLGANNLGATATRFQAAANRVNATTFSWADTNNPVADLGAFIRSYRAEGPGGELHAYLAAVAAFYAAPPAGGWAVNDKFVMACGFLNYVLNGRQLLVASGATADDGSLLRADPPNPLPALHKSLCDNTHGTTLDLLPGVFGSGEIADFYGRLGLTTISVDGVTITPDCTNPPSTIDTITVSGSTDSWSSDGVALGLSLELTAPEGEIVMLATFTAQGSWSADAMPWIVFEDPFVSIRTTQAALPAVGRLGGTVKGVGRFSLAYPVSDGTWLFEGEYDPVLSPDRVFQLAGGMNLSSALPAPVSGFTTLGVSSTELLYDSTAATDKVQYVTVVITTSEAWPLLPGLSLEELEAVVTVAQPTGRRRLSADVSATFTIPGGTQSAQLTGGDAPSATIAVSASYPGGRLAGALQSGVITFDGLVGIFWPGVVPPLPKLPSITGFSAEIDTTTKDYLLSCDLNIDWPIEIDGKVLFEVETLSFWLSSVKSSVSGNLTGTVLVGRSLAGDDVQVELSATYAEQPVKSWTFAGRQVSGVLYVDTLVERFLGQGWDTGGNGKLGIQDIAFEVETGTGSYSLSGGTTSWVIEFLDDLAFSATLELHYAAGADRSELEAGAPEGAEVVVLPTTDLGRLRAAADQGLSGKISAEITYKFIDVKIYYAFAEQPARSEFGLEWGGLKGTVAKNPQQQWVGTLNLSSFSIGEMVETMVSWATGQPFGLVAPWTFLNDISLEGLELTFNFTTNEVGLSIDIGLDVGFAKVTKLTLTYKPDQEDSPVEVALEGSFFWVVDGGTPPPPGTTVTPTKVAWDATRPDNTPAPSGGGNKYLDLRLLTMGQHVTLSDPGSFDSVEDVIKALRNVKPPPSGCLVPIADDPAGHQLVYDEGSSWLIAASFGVLKVEKGKDSGDDALALEAGGGS